MDVLLSSINGACSSFGKHAVPAPAKYGVRIHRKVGWAGSQARPVRAGPGGVVAGQPTA
ncbi:hypothetical protein ACGFNP_05630 [Nonomuraea sp. NPDC049269]|uniref:hypothetical protein n=1 Tax=Nonomuraea sp. NPDC049269 TaxID=3364349 RepID=UPI00371AA82C